MVHWRQLATKLRYCVIVVGVVINAVARATTSSPRNFSASATAAAACYDYAVLDTNPDEKLSGFSPVSHATVDVSDTLFPGVVYRVSPNVSAIRVAPTSSSSTSSLPLDRFHVIESTGGVCQMTECANGWMSLQQTGISWTFDVLPDVVRSLYLWFIVEDDSGVHVGSRSYRAGNGCAVKLDGSAPLDITDKDIPTRPATAPASPSCSSFVFEVVSRGISELTITSLGIPQGIGSTDGNVDADVSDGDNCDARKVVVADSFAGVRRVMCRDESHYYPWHLVVPVTGNFTVEINFPRREAHRRDAFHFHAKPMDCQIAVKDATGSLRIEDFRRFVERGCDIRFSNPSGYVRHFTLVMEQEEPLNSSQECDLAVKTWTRQSSEHFIACFPSNSTDMTLARNEAEFRVSFTKAIAGAMEISYWTSVDVRSWSNDESVAACPYGWVPFGRLCLAAFFDAVTWGQAKADCAQRGAMLVTISEKEQEMFITEYLNASDPDGVYAFWIGATDHEAEGTWLWSDGKPVKSRTNWFPGWTVGEANLGGTQPSDDGFSNEDCVELRRNFRFPGIGYQFQTLAKYFWNDRNCDAKNPYICQTVKARSGAESSSSLEFSLSPSSPTVVITSPKFPEYVGTVQNMSYLVSAPSGFRILLSFNAFDLEMEPICGYDYLEVYDDVGEEVEPRVFCGDYTDRLKLLNVISKESSLRLVLKTDHSYDSAGFSAVATIHKVDQLCEDGAASSEESSGCYWLISYPKVSFEGARHLCREYEANLTSIDTDKDDVRVNKLIHEFGVTQGDDAVFWTGGQLSSGHWVWENAAHINYSFYVPRWKLSSSKKRLCLSYRMRVRKFKEFIWSVENCDILGGAVCRSTESRLPRAEGNLSLWVSEEPEGSLRYPGDFRSSEYYANAENVSFEIMAPSPSAKLVVHIDALDVEYQRDCLYDHLRITDSVFPSTSETFCGTLPSWGRVFRSRSNAITVDFLSDASVVGRGFHLRWTSFDDSSCKKSIFNETSGVIERTLLPIDAYFNITCSLTITIPSGYSRIILLLDQVKGGLHQQDNLTQLALAEDCPEDEPFIKIYPLSSKEGMLALRCQGWWRGEMPLLFVSSSPELTLEFPHDFPLDFRGSFLAISDNDSTSSEQVIIHRLTEAGELRQYNYPLAEDPSDRFVVTRKLLAPLGWKIIINFTVDHSGSNSRCLVITDPILEALRGSEKAAEGRLTEAAFGRSCSSQLEEKTLESFMHFLVVRDDGSVKFSASYEIVRDVEFPGKSLQLETAGVDLSSCDPNPCVNNGTCLDGRCSCPPFFKGFFCQTRECEENPCHNDGKCVPLPRSFQCNCPPEYTGAMCESKIGACILQNPCRRRGNCTDLDDGGFVCSCRLPWEGISCEREVLRISYKPLSKRMLEEPFWLGMITVASVLAIISSVWCLKRRFADKLDKLMSDQIERSKWGGNASCELSRASSIREIAATVSGGDGTHTPIDPAGNVSPGHRRKLLGKIGFRKPSLLSLSSNASSPGGRDPNRSFSLEDFLRRSSRTPSPRRTSHARLSDSGKMDSLERKRLLKSLLGTSITRVDGPRPDKAGHNETDLEPEDFNMEELAHLGERLQILLRPRSPAETDVELYFPDDSIESNDGPGGATGGTHQKRIKVTVSNSDLDPKLERRVTFAKMVNQVCKELTSSSSEIEGSGAEERQRKAELGNNDARDEEGSSRSGHFSTAAHVHQHPPRRHRKFRFGGGRHRAKGFFRRQPSVSEDRNADVSSSDNVSTLDVTTTVRRRDRLFGKHSRLLSGNSSDSVQEDNGRNHRGRADSNDSVLSLSIFRKKPFRRSSSSLASPLGSEADDSSAVPTPISTPGSPTGHVFVQQTQSNPGLHREGSASSLTASGPNNQRRESSSEESCDVGSKSVEVPVVTVQRVGGSGSLLVPSYSGHPSGGHIMLEYYDGDMSYPLSPIKEVPTPMISPCPTPRRLSTVSIRGRSPAPSRQGTLGDDDTESEPTSTASGRSPMIVVQTGPWLTQQEEITVVGVEALPAIPEIIVSSPTKAKPPPLIVSSPDLNPQAQEDEPPVKLFVPFDTAPRTRSQSLEFPRGTTLIPADGDQSGNYAVIPTLTITPSTPPGTPRCSSPVQIITVVQDHQVTTQIQTSPVPVIEISSPPRTPTEPAATTPQRAEPRRKSSVTFDLPPMKSSEDEDWASKRHAAPKITVTAESDDTDACELPTNQNFKINSKRCAPAFLSPFGGGTPRTTSESNLSSSGYSSMASPSSSRSGSVKTICEPESPGAIGHKGLHHVQAFIYRVVPMKPIVSASASEDIPLRDMPSRKSQQQSRKNHQSDEATTTDTDYGAEHDSAIDSSDNLDFKTTRVIRESFTLRSEKISEESCTSDDDREKSAPKDKEALHCNQSVVPAIVIDACSSEEVVSETDVGGKSRSSPTTAGASSAMAATPPPSAPSPTSITGAESSGENHSKQCWNGSRSESPLSENGQCFIYCPQFFNSTGKELLYTDSDGLYDCPSSEVNPSDSPTKQNKQKPGGRRMGKKREKVRKQPAGSKSSEAITGDDPPGPNNDQGNVRSPGSSPARYAGPSRRKSPKMRAKTSSQALESTSSSMESLRSSSSGTRKSAEESSQRSPTRTRKKTHANPRNQSVQHNNSLENMRPKPGIPTVTIDGADGAEVNTSRPETPISEWASVSKDSAISSMQVVADASGEDSLEDEPSLRVDLSKMKRKHPRFRSVGHQIRFICRLQRSLTKLKQDRGEDESDNLFVGSSSLDSGDKIPSFQSDIAGIGEETAPLVMPAGQETIMEEPIETASPAEPSLTHDEITFVGFKETSI